MALLHMSRISTTVYCKKLIALICFSFVKFGVQVQETTSPLPSSSHVVNAGCRHFSFWIDRICLNLKDKKASSYLCLEVSSMFGQHTQLFQLYLCAQVSACVNDQENNRKEK